MDNRTFALITAIQAECIESWGTVKDVETVTHFGTEESILLEGMYIYIYYEKDKIYCFIDAVKPDMILSIDESCDLWLYKI